MIDPSLQTSLPKRDSVRRWRQIAGIVPLLLAALVAGCSTQPRSTKDADLVEHFLAHEADFEKLRSMLAEDRELGTMYSDGSYSGQSLPSGENVAVKLSPARVAQYREAMRLAGFADRDLFSAHSGAEHRVDIVVGGLPCGKDYVVKGYVYSSKELQPLKDTLDLNDGDEMKAGDCWYKRIKGNWYLYADNCGTYV